MQNIDQSFQTLGLTPNQTTIYTFLLRKGLSTGTEIYRENSLDKSSAYEALAGLQNHGLIYIIGAKRNQKFGAVPAEKLQELLRDKQQQLDATKQNLDTFIADIDTYARQTYKNKNIRIFEGQNGFLTWSHARLETPNTTLRTLASYQLHATYLPTYNKQYKEEQVKLRLSQNIFQKVLTKKSDLNKDFASIDSTNPKLKKEIRLLPDNFEIQSSLATFANKTSFLSQKDGKFLGIIIEDSLITNLASGMFDLIWSHAKKS